jgi:RNA-binding protein NOB1
LNENEERCITEPLKEVVEFKQIQEEPPAKKTPHIVEEPTIPNVVETSLSNKEENTQKNDDDWITLDNLEQKLHTNTFFKEQIEENKKLTISIQTSDFALQNLALKMGILINSIDGIRITRIKNYILKCYACNTFNFDTSRLFCEFCGYTTLMKIGYSVSDDGNVIIRDKEADPRLRGTQVVIIFILVRPSQSNLR